MTYRFVAAPKYTAGGMVEPRAIVWHMAEGGGTVSWLSRADGAQGNNSSHFVIEYDGEIVQMVRDADASWSLHVSRPYGPPGAGDFGIFSLDVAKALLGTGISDPNRYIFAVELEGFAASGPNPAQRASMLVLAADLRARHPSIRGNLGHRDFQNYKPCPGGLIPWASLGGHGLSGTATPTVPATAGGEGMIDIQRGTTFPVIAAIGAKPLRVAPSDTAAVFVNLVDPPTNRLGYVGSVPGTDWRIVAYPEPAAKYGLTGSPVLFGLYIKQADIWKYEDAPAAPAPTSPNVDAAVKAAVDPLLAKIGKAKEALA